MESYKPNVISGICAATAGVCAKFAFNVSDDEPFGNLSPYLRVLIHLFFLALYILANAVML